MLLNFKHIQSSKEKETSESFKNFKGELLKLGWFFNPCEVYNYYTRKSASASFLSTSASGGQGFVPLWRGCLKGGGGQLDIILN